MDKVSRVIKFDAITNPTKKEIENLGYSISQLFKTNQSDRSEIDDLLQRMKKLADKMNIQTEDISLPDAEGESLNLQVDDLLLTYKNFPEEKYSKFPKLTTQEIIMCNLIGMISVLIDVIFVGTPEVVKIYRGGEKFDGSILTGMLRKIGNNDNGELSPFFKWFSDKCKVPYDISLKSGVVTPNNHRLRSFAHDPFLGILFAVADIILGTTTCVDNNGKLEIIVNKKKALTAEKWLAVLYYIGHIISDICTSRGIPIPGFCLTQFFTAEIGDSSIAEIAESMYKDGYDLRHAVSMSVPVFVKDVLINMYIKLTSETQDVVSSIVEREKYEMDFKLKTYKMKFIANSIATVGNVVKFVAPPNCGNPCALNLVQWKALIQNGIDMCTATSRDFSGEEAMYNRHDIDLRWKELLS